MSLLKEVCHYEADFEVSKPHTVPSLFSLLLACGSRHVRPACCSSCQVCHLLPLLHYHRFLPSGTVSSYKPFLLLVALVMAFYHFTRKGIFLLSTSCSVQSSQVVMEPAEKTGLRTLSNTWGNQGFWPHHVSKHRGWVNGPRWTLRYSQHQMAVWLGCGYLCRLFLVCFQMLCGLANVSG